MLERKNVQPFFKISRADNTHGAFPPTKCQPVAGGPVHSWRVLLFPILTGKDSKYDFSQEWNSPTNLQALGPTAPHRFRLTGDGDTSHYLAIGPNDEWPLDKWNPLRSLLTIRGKDRFAPVAPIHYRVNCAGILASQLARHARKMAATASCATIKN